MASPKFADGAAVLLRASGEAATVVRLAPANGVDPATYYEIRMAAPAQPSVFVAEGALMAAPAQAPTSAETPAVEQVAQPVNTPAPAPAPAPADPATLIADAEALLHEAIATATPPTTSAKSAVPE